MNPKKITLDDHYMKILSYMHPNFIHKFKNLELNMIYRALNRYNTGYRKGVATRVMDGNGFLIF